MILAEESVNELFITAGKYLGPLMIGCIIHLYWQVMKCKDDRVAMTLANAQVCAECDKARAVLEVRVKTLEETSILLRDTAKVLAQANLIRDDELKAVKEECRQHREAAEKAAAMIRSKT